MLEKSSMFDIFVKSILIKERIFNKNKFNYSQKNNLIIFLNYGTNYQRHNC